MTASCCRPARTSRRRICAISNEAVPAAGPRSTSIGGVAVAAVDEGGRCEPVHPALTHVVAVRGTEQQPRLEVGRYRAQPIGPDARSENDAGRETVPQIGDHLAIGADVGAGERGEADTGRGGECDEEFW